MRVDVRGRAIDFVPWGPEMGRVFGRSYALAAATSRPDPRRPWLTPPYVLGAACDGRRGYFLDRGHTPAFLAAHDDLPVAVHDAAFVLAVLHALDPGAGVYGLVDRDLVSDPLILHRLLCLAEQGQTDDGEGRSTLAYCAGLYPGAGVTGDPLGRRGDAVRASYGRWLNRDPREVEPAHLERLARDAAVTRRLDRHLRKRLEAVLTGSTRAWGHVSDRWLGRQIRRWGPSTSLIQLRAAIVLRDIAANGLRVDLGRSELAVAGVRAAIAELRGELVAHGYLPGQASSRAALGKILARIERKHAGPGARPHVRRPDLDLGRRRWPRSPRSTPSCGTLLEYQSLETLESNFLSKMGRSVLHPSFDVLKTTGRTSSFGEIDAQNLPRDERVRRCFVPRPGHVLVDPRLRGDRDGHARPGRASRSSAFPRGWRTR